MIRRILIVALVVVGLAAWLERSRRRAEPLHVSGFIEAHEARVGSRVGGRIRAIRVEEGQRVAPGDPLVELEPFDWPAQRAAAAAELARREAVLAELQAGARPEELAQARARHAQALAALADLERGARPQELAQARAQLDEALAALELARAEHERVASLQRGGVSPPEELDRARRTLRAAEATVEARRQALALLEAGARPDQIARARAQVEETSAALALLLAGARREQLEQARAAVAAARAQVEALDRRLDELTVRASMAGRVEAIELRPGDLAPPDAPLLTLIDPDALWVRAYVPEGRLELQVGQRVWVSVDAFPGERFAGRISFIARRAEFTPNNVQTPEDRSQQVLRIRVELEEGQGRLLPGMGADVWFDAAGGR